MACCPLGQESMWGLKEPNNEGQDGLGRVLRPQRDGTLRGQTHRPSWMWPAACWSLGTNTKWRRVWERHELHEGWSSPPGHSYDTPVCGGGPQVGRLEAGVVLGLSSPREGKGERRGHQRREAESRRRTGKRDMEKVCLEGVWRAKKYIGGSRCTQNNTQIFVLAKGTYQGRDMIIVNKNKEKVKQTRKRRIQGKREEKGQGQGKGAETRKGTGGQDRHGGGSECLIGIN